MAKLSHAKTISKLGNAIRVYRGTYNPSSGKWIRPPNLSKAADVLKWLTQLGFPPLAAKSALNRIDGFKTFDEMRTWMNHFN